MTNYFYGLTERFRIRRMTIYFRVEIPASRHNDVTAGGNGGVFHDRDSAETFKKALIERREYCEADIWITTASE